MRMRASSSVFVAVVIGTLLVVAASGASAATPTGFDISYPQCNAPFPAGGSFRIVGVNGGRVYSANPCLGIGSGPSELAWAGVYAGLYANTGNPGPALSSHWPNGQTAPVACNTAANPGSDTPECSYDYGWNAATDSYSDVVKAEAGLGWIPAGSTRTAAANEWWLDVESANSWRSDVSLNVQALRGAADYLSSVGAALVGFYANAGDWQSITGNTVAFSARPTWLAGPVSLSDAQSRCGTPGFTGGTLALAQYPSGGFDGDVDCRTQVPSTLTSITISPSSSTVRAGARQAFTATGHDQYGNVVAVSPTWTISSAVGTFSSTSGSSVTFTATQTGTATITATSGQVSGTATVTVTAKRHH